MATLTQSRSGSSRISSTEKRKKRLKYGQYKSKKIDLYEFSREAVI